MATAHHAEHVGSMLRPPGLLEARAAHKRGKLGTEKLRELEDEAAREAIAIQRQAGIEVFTDGEVRRDTWMAEGSYEPVAERLFGEVGVDRFLLEYDTPRAGGFEPLRFVPPGVVVVLGLISSKTPALESQDDLRRRLDQASKYVPLENLAISPQCGFASTARGNLLTVDQERRKLELVVDTAGKVWG